MSTSRSLSAICAVAVALLASPAAFGTGPLQATAQAERGTVQVGQPLRITVIVRNCDGPPDIQPPTSNDFVIGPAGPAGSRPSALAGVEPLQPGGPLPGRKLIEALRESTDKIASAQLDPSVAKQLQDPGLMNEFKAALADLKKDDYAVVFVLQPTKAGAVTVPAFTVKSGGQTATTQPIALTVTNPQPQGWVRLNLSLSNPRPFPGDEVQLYVDTIIRRGPVTLGRKTYPHFPVRDVTLTIPTLEGEPVLELAESLGQALRERAAQPGQHGFRVNNVPGEFIPEHEPADAPQEAGWYRRRFAIPLRVREAGKAVIPPAKVGGEVYLSSGGNSGRWVPFTATSEPLSVSTRDPGGRPRDFTGGVGTFRLTAKASQTEMPAGTPFVFTLRQEGEGNLARATPPDLNAQPGFSDRFESAKSEPIPLKVTPAPPAAAAPAPAAPDVPAIRPEDVLTEKLAEPAPSSPDRSRLWREFSYAVALLLGSVALGYVIWRYRKHYPNYATPVSNRRQTIDATLLRLRAPNLSVPDVRQAVQDFLRARFDLPPGEVTPKDAEDCLRQAGYGEKLARECAEVLSGCDAAEFAPGLARPAAELAAKAEEVIHSILETTPAPLVATEVMADELTRERQAAVAR